jgi:ankyrin repeat protein
MYASYKGHKDIVKYLIDKEADINIQNNVSNYKYINIIL